MRLKCGAEPGQTNGDGPVSFRRDLPIIAVRVRQFTNEARRTCGFWENDLGLGDRIETAALLGDVAFACIRGFRTVWVSQT